MDIDLAKMSQRDKPTLTALITGKGYLVVTEGEYSFTEDENKASRFLDRYGVIQAVNKFNIPGTYMITDSGK